ARVVANDLLSKESRTRPWFLTGGDRKAGQTRTVSWAPGNGQGGHRRAAGTSVAVRETRRLHPGYGPVAEPPGGEPASRNHARLQSGPDTFSRARRMVARRYPDARRPEIAGEAIRHAKAPRGRTQSEDPPSGS